MLKFSPEMTAEEYFEYVEQHPDTHFDFIDGELVEVSPKVIHSWIQALLARIFGNYLDGKKFQPDVSINAPTDADYFTSPPVVAVEIRSDTQFREAQRRKARDYIALGTPLVLVMIPNEHIEVYRSGHETMILGPGDTLTGYDVLPGFELAVSNIFRD